MREFNAFQIVAFFAAFPFLIGWLSTKPFPYAGLAMGVACLAYLVYFGFMCSFVYEGTKDAYKS